MRHLTSRLLAVVLPLAILAGTGVASAAVHGPASWRDFNGDGRADLAIGVPGEDLNGISGAGAVEILYGAKGGLTAIGSQFLTQSSPGVADAPEAGDHFGSAVASGDFNDDGFADLAIGVAGEDVGGDIDAGAVNIVYGSAQGLHGDARQPLLVREPGAARPGCQFGYALATLDVLGPVFVPIAPQGELDPRDGIADLAVGAPGCDSDVGEVWILARGRLSPDITSSVGVRVDTGFGYGSRSGAALAVGNFDISTIPDLAIGAPGTLRFASTAALRRGGNAARTGTASRTSRARSANGVRPSGGTPVGGAGAVAVMMNGSPGAIERWARDSQIPGPPSVNEHLGASLAAGDLDDDGRDDLAVGAPGVRVAGRAQAGTVFVIYASYDGSGLYQDYTTVSVYREGAIGVPGTPGANAHFGASVAIAQLGQVNAQDLAIGIPGATVKGQVGAGAVDILYSRLLGAAGGLGAREQRWTQASAGILGTPVAGDHFGAELSARNLDKSGPADLVISTPDEGVNGQAGAGWIHILFSTRDGGVGATGAQAWSQDSLGVPDAAEPGDHFGGAIH